MTLQFKIDILWQEFQRLLEKDNDAARIIKNKLIKATNKEGERRKLLFSLVRAYLIKENRFSITLFQKYLRLLGIQHLESEVMLKEG